MDCTRAKTGKNEARTQFQFSNPTTQVKAIYHDASK